MDSVSATGGGTSRSQPLRRLTADELRALARSFGVPDDADARRAVYLIRPGSQQAEAGWPIGQLTFIGAIRAAASSSRPRPVIDRDGEILEVYWSELLLPSRRASVMCAWKPRASRIDLMPGRWTKGDAEDAEAALRWLESLSRPSGGPHATSPEDAFEQAVGFGLEWLDDHPLEHPKNFGVREFAAKRCTGIPAAHSWMKDKGFGIKQVRREVAKRAQWPT